jgi:5-dehydro-4-deoxyglucarate dehydratase
VLAFPITPFSPTGEVDRAAVGTNASWLSASGVRAIVAPSGTGEFFGLSPDEAVVVTEGTVRAAAGRVPVVAGVGVGPRVAADFARRAEDAGAEAILVLPPYYSRPEPAALVGYYEAVAGATSLPLIPYQRDAAILTPILLDELLRRVPSVVAFKDGSGDIRLFQRLREHVRERWGEDRLVWLAGAGDDLAGPYYAAGADGFSSSLACFWPEAALELERLARNGDFGRLRSYQSQVVRPFYELRQRRPGFEVAVMKAAMELLGHPAGPVRPPLANLGPGEREELAAILRRLDVPTRAVRAARSAYSSM